MSRPPRVCFAQHDSLSCHRFTVLAVAAPDVLIRHTHWREKGGLAVDVAGKPIRLLDIIYATVKEEGLVRVKSTRLLSARVIAVRCDSSHMVNDVGILISSRTLPTMSAEW